MRRVATGLVCLALAAVVFTPAQAAQGIPGRATVVREWSRLLNKNDNAAIARLFAVPATIVQGPYVYRLRTRKQVELWHQGLPCAGRITSIRVRGRFVTAEFVLSDRKGSRCDGPGARAAARFEIVRGKIRSWVQVQPQDPAPDAPTA
jgi:hypothetical protein